MNVTFTNVGPHCTLLFERDMPHSRELVWRALTERELLRQWFPCDVEGEWVPGAKLRFIFQGNEGDGLSDEDLRGEVVKVDAPHCLEFTWGDYRYQCTLTAKNDGCTLSFLDRFDDASMAARDAAGWEMCFDNLDRLLADTDVEAFAVNVWQERFDHYCAQFEQEAGPQLGLPENHPTNGGSG